MENASALTMALYNILLVCFSLAILSGVLLAAETFINDRKREKREVESSKRDAEYHQKRMQEFQK